MIKWHYVGSVLHEIYEKPSFPSNSNFGIDLYFAYDIKGFWMLTHFSFRGATEETKKAVNLI